MDGVVVVRRVYPFLWDLLVFICRISWEPPRIERPSYRPFSSKIVLPLVWHVPMTPWGL